MVTYSHAQLDVEVHTDCLGKRELFLFFGVIIDLNLPAFISLKMLQIKWMNLLSEVLSKRTARTAEGPVLLHPQSLFHVPSTCFSKQSPHQTSARSRILLSSEAEMHWDALHRQTAYPAALFRLMTWWLAAADTFAGRRKWQWTLFSYSFIHRCTLGRSNLLPKSWPAIYQGCF